MLRTSQLQAIVALSDSSSIRAASRQLGLSQSALSRTLRELESEFEEPLFMRHGYGTDFTAAGKMLVSHARLALNAIRRAKDETLRLSGRVPPMASIALAPALAVLGFERIIKEFYDKYPNGKLEVDSGVLSNIVPRLVDGKLDVAFSLADKRDLPYEILFEPLGQLQMVPVTNSNSGISLDATWEELASQRWAINPMVGGADASVVQWLESRAIFIKEAAIHCSSPYLLSILSQKSKVLTLCPKQALSTSFLKDVREIRVSELPPPTPVGALYLRQMPLSDITRLLIESVKKICLKYACAIR
jgi:LysR family transcriptional regulator, regulator of abg operon